MARAAPAVALWGDEAPAHSISAVLIADDQATLVTGSREGPLCLWRLSPRLQVSARQMLFGHHAPVTCLAKARDFEKQPYVASAAEDGSLRVWDVASGQCVESTQSPFRHTAICFYHSSCRMTGEGWLLCCGHYADVLVVDAKTLAVLHSLSSSQASDWVSCLCLARSPRIQEDSLIAVTAAGDLQVWDLSSSVSRIQGKQNVPEKESRPLGSAPCRAVRFCIYTERLLLVVFSRCWKVYDYCDFSLLWTEFSPGGQSFAGGEMLAAHRLIVWREDGRGFIYQLLSSGLSRSTQPWNGRAAREALSPLLLCSTVVGEHQSFSCTMGFLSERKEPFHKILYSGETSGRITLWHIPDVLVSTLDGSPKEIPVASSWTLQNSFDTQGDSGSLLEPLCGASSGDRGATVTSAVYVPSREELVCGCEDGRIFVLPALPAIRARLLKSASLPEGARPHRLLRGRPSRVTALMHLHSHSARFDPSWLLSGSQDSCTTWWDMLTGEMLHCFSLQAGPVSRLLLSAEGYRFQGQRLVGCVCGDHSVMLLHLQARTCVLRARKHLFPVRLLRWHPAQNLLVVGCENASAYVWDIEMGILERHETGGAARTLLACCEESVEEPLLVEGAPREQQAAPGQVAARAGAPLGSVFAPQGQPSRHPPPPASHPQRPFTILPGKVQPGDPLFHLLLFDPEPMATQLLQVPRLGGTSSPGSFRGFGSLKRRQGSAGKRPQLLKRSRTSGGPLPADGGSGQKRGFASSERSGGLRRPRKARGSRRSRRESLGRVSPELLWDAATVFLSCLLPWGLDGEVDSACTLDLGLLPLACPASFGLMAIGGRSLSLALPGPGNRHPAAAGQPGRAPNLSSCRVPEMGSKYLRAAQAQQGRAGGRRERPLALPSLLGALCLAQRIMGQPPEKAGPQKRLPTHSRRKPTPPPGALGPCREPAAACALEGLSGESEDSHLVKLLSCWREQSVQVAEALQAALLAEVRSSLGSPAQAVLGSCGHLLACGEAPEAEQPGATEAQPWHGKAPQGVFPAEKMTFPLQDDESKSRPWVSKVCSCKVC